MNARLLSVVGGFGGFIGIVLVLIICGMIFRSRTRKRPTRRAKPTGRVRESANWLNVSLARLNSVRADQVAMQAICEFVSQTISSDPNRPDILSYAKITPVKPATKTPFFSEFVITPSEDGSSLSLCVNFQGAPSIAVRASASSGPVDLPKLFTVTLDLEFILELLVARVTIICDENNEMWLSIGNDLIIDMRVKPIFDDQQNMQTKHVESISTWLSNAILKSLRGKRIPILQSARHDSS